MGSETLLSALYILSDESSIPFYSTTNGYKNRRHFFFNCKVVSYAGMRLSLARIPFTEKFIKDGTWIGDNW